MPCCPTCHSEHIIKNGSIHTGKQKYACNTCGQQLVVNELDDGFSNNVSDQIIHGAPR